MRPAGTPTTWSRVPKGGAATLKERIAVPGSYFFFWGPEKGRSPQTRPRPGPHPTSNMKLPTPDAKKPQGPATPN
ncbi:hypothetical protein NDU88_002054 [Pleurodeles waltl]|uniref:Uncharacterized protein n=1 Tax=Pleurodeles waltl TaxID=8319 RepID=A0AAV7P606_PLEWA|nr:hypothetical protein NDU88_002054 [Pleurodeles waltl]